MIQSQNPKLQSIVGKTVKSVKVSDSHGECVIIKFTDGKELVITEYDYSLKKTGLYVAIDEVEL